MLHTPSTLSIHKEYFGTLKILAAPVVQNPKILDYFNYTIHSSNEPRNAASPQVSAQNLQLLLGASVQNFEFYKHTEETKNTDPVCTHETRQAWKLWRWIVPAALLRRLKQSQTKRPQFLHILLVVVRNRGRGRCPSSKVVKRRRIVIAAGLGRSSFSSFGSHLSH